MQPRAYHRLALSYILTRVLRIVLEEIEQARQSSVCVRQMAAFDMANLVEQTSRLPLVGSLPIAVSVYITLSIAVSDNERYARLGT